MDFNKIITQIQGEADEAGLNPEKYMKAVAVRQAHQVAEETARRASEDDKEKIKAELTRRDGELTIDTPISEILAMAGVRKVQGTSSFTRQEVRRLLTHHKTEEESTATAQGMPEENPAPTNNKKNKRAES